MTFTIECDVGAYGNDCGAIYTFLTAVKGWLATTEHEQTFDKYAKDKLVTAIKLYQTAQDAKVPPKHRCTAEVLEGLSPKHRDIVTMAASGLTRHEIAETLRVSYDTVKHTLQGVRNKIAVRYFATN